MHASAAKSIRSLLLATLVALAGCDVSGPGLLVGQIETNDDAPSAKSQEEASDCTTPDKAAALADQLLRLINIERFEIGAVELDPRLSQIAADYGCEMIDYDFFGHANPVTGKGLSERAADTHYPYLTLGENLAAGIIHMPAVIDAWNASEAHRDVMLDPAFTKAGIAVRFGGDYEVYCVLMLAQPLK